MKKVRKKKILKKKKFKAKNQPSSTMPKYCLLFIAIKYFKY